MLAVISPAKTLDFKTPLPNIGATQPNFLPQSEDLVQLCRKFNPAELASLMHISDKLAGLNVARFMEWQLEHNEENARQAMFAFKGEVYSGLDAYSLTLEDIQFAQEHLRMLSGLYGILRPLDLIQPHRLEMGTKLINEKGKNLYEFWGNQLAQNMQNFPESRGSEVLINLASDEYFKALKPYLKKMTVIKPIFLDEKNGRYKVISIYAKKARGLMCRYLIQNRLNDPKVLKAFDLGGYAFCQAESTKTEWVFKR